MKRKLAIWLTTLATCMGAGAVAADTFPSRPIKLVIPYAPGGVTDQIGRALAEAAGRTLGQPMVVENRPGANGTLGVVQMKATKPDGYAVTMVPIGTYRMPYLQEVAYDPIRDLTHISMITGFDYFVAVNASSPWQTLKDLIEHARAQPEAVSYGTPGAFSGQHIGMVQLGDKAGVRWTHVPFKGDAEAIPALLGDHIQAVVGANTLVRYSRSGQVRVLAALGSERAPDFPDVPTVSELGYDVVQSSPFGVAGPAGMPAAVIEKLDAAFRAAVVDPSFTKLLAQYGVASRYMDHASYTAFARKLFDDEREAIGKLKTTLK
jgi:tripartite-type tricarboxylate transporter receptor subunit TctC